MKILVYTLMHPRTPRLFGRTNQSIFRQNYETLDMLFSKRPNPHDTGVSINDGRLDILERYNRARDQFLQGDWDALLTVEYDMVLPPDAVTRLIDCNSDVAYGLYCFRGNNWWSAYTELEAGRGVSVSHDIDQAREHWGNQMSVKGVGLGCTLIKRHVLAETPFRGILGAACDWHFCIDLQEKGFTQVCDLGLICGHISLTPSPRVIYPDINMPELFRNDYITGIPVAEDGTVAIEIGTLGTFSIGKRDLVKT